MPFYVDKTHWNLTHWAFKQLRTKSLYSRRAMIRRTVSGHENFSVSFEKHGAAWASLGRRTLLLLHVGEVFKREGSHRGSPEGVGLHDGLQASPDRHKQTDKLFQKHWQTRVVQTTWAHRATQSLVRSDLRREDFNSVGLIYLWI